LIPNDSMCNKYLAKDSAFYDKKTIFAICANCLPTGRFVAKSPADASVTFVPYLR